MREILQIGGAAMPGMSSFNCDQNFRKFLIVGEVVIFADDRISIF